MKDFSDRNQETISILQKLISIPTVDPPGNELEAARMVASILERENIESRIFDLGNGRANLVAKIVGKKEKPSLIYSAHFDTIAVDEKQWSCNPFGGDIINGKLYGRGSSDMKSGLVSMLLAAIILKRRKAELKGDLILAFSAAENSSCMGAKELVNSGQLADAGALLVAEPSSLKVIIAQKGAIWIRAIAKGEYGHNAFSEKRKGDRGNAIVRMAKFVERVQSLELQAKPHPHLGQPTVNIGIIRGGEHPVIIPEKCEILIDIRTVPQLEPDMVLEEFKKIAGHDISIEMLDIKPPVNTDENHEFVADCVNACVDVMGEKPAVTGVPYYTDGTVLAPALNVPMVIIGPGEIGLSGAVDEFVEVDKLHKATEVFIRIAERHLGVDGVVSFE